MNLRKTAVNEHRPLGMPLYYRLLGKKSKDREIFIYNFGNMIDAGLKLLYNGLDILEK